jgi:hypothetical protein
MSEPLTGETVFGQARWTDWLGGAGLAVTLGLLLASSILKRYSPLGSNLVLALDLAAFVPCMALMFWSALDRREWDEKTARRWADLVQRERHIFTWSMICLWTVMAYQQGSFRVPSSWLTALLIGCCFTLGALQLVGGWTPWKRRYRTLGDDELTAALRGKAMTVGYVVLFLGVAVGYPVSLRWPGATRAIFLGVLWLGMAVPALTLMWLENRAEQDG